MRTLAKLPATMKDAYWEVVHDCLVEFGGFSSVDAMRVATARRAAVEFAPPRLRSDIFYHQEPFDVAANLAESVRNPSAGAFPTLDDPQTNAAYATILRRHGLA